MEMRERLTEMREMDLQVQSKIFMMQSNYSTAFTLPQLKKI